MKKIYLFFVFFLFFSTVSAETISCPGNKEIDRLIEKGTTLNNEGEIKKRSNCFKKLMTLLRL